MLKSLRVKNFESHVNTHIEFAPGLTLITGRSNTGKTSIIRALKLVCFNEFSPASIRVGKSSCEVLLETDKGTVEVKRGPKINRWTIQKTGEQKQVFNKPGTSLLPEVIEVTGMKPMELGDRKVFPNVMDQLEGHFLLAELGGSSVSGSYRAQVLDEIAGLSGMEELVKSISLDQTRLARSIKEKEGQIEDISSKKHDEHELERRRELLVQIETNTLIAQDHSHTLLNGNNTLLQGNILQEELELLETRYTQLSQISPSSLLDTIEKLSDRVIKMHGLLNRSEEVQDELELLEKKAINLSDTVELDDFLSQVQSMAKIVDQANELSRSMGSISASEQSLGTKYHQEVESITELLKEAHFCPLCGQACEKGCFTGE